MMVQNYYIGMDYLMIVKLSILYLEKSIFLRCIST